MERPKGSAAVAGDFFDMNMLAVSTGRQRNLEELDALFAASGWRRAGLSPTHTVDSLLELEAV